MRRAQRPSSVALGALGLLALALAATFAHAAGLLGTAPDPAPARALVQALDLTDIALFNEARYTRNPALADLHSAFQDGPLSLEHFPSGTLVAPAPRRNGR